MKSIIAIYFVLILIKEKLINIGVSKVIIEHLTDIYMANVANI
jgi:hypothetical protein